MQRTTVRSMDEERLLEGLRFGDPGAFKKLFDRYWEDLYYDDTVSCLSGLG